MKRSRWNQPLLACIACAAAACFPAGGSPGSEPLFTLLPSSRTGVGFANMLPENPMMNGFVYEYYYNGGGVAAGDLTGNGFPDLYFTSNLSGNRLYLNHGGMRFEDVTERAGVGGRAGGWATGVTFADVDADGRLDIHVSYSGPFSDPDMRRNMLYINQGVRDGVPVFTEAAEAYGLDDPGYSTQAAFFDYDGDGRLDMYLMNHGVDVHRGIAEMKAGRSPYEMDRLFRGAGDGFVDVSAEVGLIDTNLGYGLGVSIGDFNNDGRPDIYVANDYAGRDYLYLNQPDGRFSDVLERSMAHIPFASMGSDIADIDGDGWLDLAVLEMAMPTHFDRKSSESGTEAERFAEVVREGQHYQYAANALQWNRGVRGDGVPVFSEIAYLAGVARTDWSWAALFADFDNDGRPDLFASTGIAGNFIDVDFNDYRRRRAAETVAAEGRITHSLVLEFLRNLPRREVPNAVYRNEGDLTFSDQTITWGLDRPSYSNGAVYVDLTRDGALDLVVNNLMGEAFIYRNNARAAAGSRHFLAIQLRGPAGNPFGVGARVRLMAGGEQQVQELHLTRGYQSSVEPVLHFGLGEHAAVDTLEVTWPDGSRQLLTGVESDRYITLEHAAARPGAGSAALANGGASSGSATTMPRFSDARAALRPVPRHHGFVSVVDSALQPYPSRRDELALAVGDLNGNGLDDFFFGGSGDEPSRIYEQQEDGTLRAAAAPLATTGTEQIAAATIFDTNGDGLDDLWVVVTDTGSSPPVHRHRLYLNEGGARFREAPDRVPPLTSAAVVLAAGDFDGDGHLDLFVGSRSVPGTGPMPGSQLLRNDGGTFRDVTLAAAPVLAELRTVTGAVWADVSANGAADLVVVGEWMPVTLLVNERGSLRDGTAAAGLDGTTGWWQSVAAADLTGNGSIDIIAGNMGLNFPYHLTAAEPFELYVHTFGGGKEIAVPAYYEEGTRYPWFGRTRLAWQLPALLRRFPTHAAFARASLKEVLGEDALRDARRYDAKTLASMVLENTGAGRFRALALPPAAQIAPVTGIVVADFDGDRVPDLVIAGNIHALEVNVPKAGASVGLFLRGDGSGGFQPVMPAASGLLIEGQVRGLALLTGGEGVPGVIAGVAGGEAAFLRVAPPKHLARVGIHDER